MKKAPIKEIRAKLAQYKEFKDALVTYFGSDDEVVIRTKTSSKSVSKDVGAEVAQQFLSSTGKLEIRRVDMSGLKLGMSWEVRGLQLHLIGMTIL